MGLAEQNKALETKVNDLLVKLNTLNEENRKLQPMTKKDEDFDKAKETDISDEHSDVRRATTISKKDKRRAQKLKKQAAQVKAPKTDEIILFKETESEDWKSGRVVGSWKKNSKYKS